MILEVNINEIKPNPQNPRVIKDDKFKKLVQSIKEFPEMLNIRPIVVNKDMIVLGGNMRLKACKEAGLKEIPIVYAENLDEDKQREFIIKDNVGFGEWDWESLKDWNQDELNDWGLDIPDFKEEHLEATDDGYEVPDEIQTDIVLGDLFEIGSHRLLCGDSTNVLDVEKLMNGQKADMVFTDPPYGANMGIQNDKTNEFKQVFSDFISILPCDDNIYVCSDWRCIGFFINEIENNNYEIYNLIVWVKNLFGQGKLYHTKHEEIIFCGKGDYRKDKLNDDVNVWNADSVRNFAGSKNAKEAVGHPTQKPIEICSRAINNSSIKNELVYDGFLGSGSTMVASHQLKRKCYGMELDPKYCQVIIDRMRKLDPSIEIKRNGILLETVGKQS